MDNTSITPSGTVIVYGADGVYERDSAPAQSNTIDVLSRQGNQQAMTAPTMQALARGVATLQIQLPADAKAVQANLTEPSEEGTLGCDGSVFRPTADTKVSHLSMREDKAKVPDFILVPTADPAPIKSEASRSQSTPSQQTQPEPVQAHASLQARSPGVASAPPSVAQAQTQQAVEAYWSDDNESRLAPMAQNLQARQAQQNAHVLEGARVAQREVASVVSTDDSTISTRS